MSQFCAYYQKDQDISSFRSKLRHLTVTGLKFSFANVRDCKCNVLGYEQAKIDSYVNQVCICHL